MKKASISSLELLAQLVPVDRLDEAGLAMYGELAATDDAETLKRGAVRLLERLCEQGYVRRLERTEVDGGVRLRYRNLLTLDTLSVVLQRPLEEAPTGRAAPREAKSPVEATPGPAEARPEMPAPRPTQQFLKAVAASSRRTDLAGAMGYLYELLRETVGYDRIAVCISRGLSNSQAGNLLEFEDLCPETEADQVAPQRIREKVEREGQTASIADLRKDTHHSRHAGSGVYGSLVVAPLKAEAYVYGTISLWSERSHAFDPNAVGVIDFVAEFAAGLIKRRLEVEELIFIDQTCQIHNRRYFDEQLLREIERCKRQGNAMALLIGDLDDFKLVNDTLGHAAGDSVLRQVGRILTENARQVDIVARYGGEEFGVILPNVTRDGALAVAERIRSTVAMHSFITGSEQQPTWDLTISIGGALYPLDAKSKGDLIDKADRIALYEAKRLGKNRVVMFPDLQS